MTQTEGAGAYIGHAETSEVGDLLLTGGPPIVVFPETLDRILHLAHQLLHGLGHVHDAVLLQMLHTGRSHIPGCQRGEPGALAEVKLLCSYQYGLRKHSEIT